MAAVLACMATITMGRNGAIAQTIPRIPPPQELIPPTPPPNLSPLTPTPPPNLEIPAPVPAQPTVPGNIPGTVVVKRFDVVGSTVFSQAELAAVTAPFTNRPISFAELLQAQSAITQYYTQRGYLTSGAVIPPQTLEGDVVTIQVVEGSLEAINITGTRRLNPNYVRSRLAIATRPPLNSQRLLEALQLLQLNPLIQSISAELSAGTKPGTNRLDVKVAEANSFNLQLGLDNGRSPAVGSFRRQIYITEANLLGQGDELSIGYANTDGSNIGELRYILPVNGRNGTVGVYTNVGRSHIVEDPFDQIDIRANSTRFDLTLRQPLFQNPSQEFALGLTFSREETQTFILEDIPLPISPGASDEGKTRISTLRFFQEWVDRRATSVFALRSEFNLGLNAFGSTINDVAPDSRFFSWRGQVQWVRLLAPDTLLLLRSDLQLANRNLLPAEQFSLGGLDSVRGYRQDLYLADNGLFASAEIRLPVLRIPEIEGVLQIAPFIDVGKAWNIRNGTDPDPSTLAAVGLGLRWQQSDRLSAQLYWGIPLVSIDSEKRTWQENGIHFSVILNLF